MGSGAEKSTLLSQVTHQEMLRGQALIDTVNKSYYGYGMKVGKRDNRDYVAHDGGWPGYATNLIRYLADDLTIIVLSKNGSDAPVISDALADILFGKLVSYPWRQVEIKIDSTILESYVGVYEIKSGRDFTVEREGDQLRIKAFYMFIQKPKPVFFTAQ